MLHLPLISSQLWNAIDDPAARIERTLTDRSYRLSIGVDVDAELRKMQCALVMTSRHGKHLRVAHVVGDETLLPKAVNENWNELRHSKTPPLAAYRQFTADLAELQIQAIEKIKRKAGKYVDRILFASVLEPGLWLSDFDGSRIYCGLTDAHRIADVTGLTVIDDYPANDVGAGGQGGPLSGLPLWLTLSDRNAKVADQHRVVLMQSETCEGYLLPASDGLDAELPEIHPISAPGMRFLRGLQTALTMDQDSLSLTEIFTSGRSYPPLIQQWNECTGDDKSLIDIAISLSQAKSLPSADVVKTAIDFIAESCLEQINRGGRGLIYLGPQPAPSNVCQIYVLGEDELSGCLINRLSKEFTDQKIVNQTVETISGQNVRGMIAGLLGILHVDQVQANIPMITGARQQRILGKLTPGSPSNWRQLVRDMSDFRPAAMKLRDAI